MPRSNRPRRGRRDEEAPELNLDLVRMGIRRSVVKKDTEYTVQTTTGANADDTKVWLCPHCNLQISKGTSHTVAWDTVRGLQTRRHFHNHCWNAFQGPLL